MAKTDRHLELEQAERSMQRRWYDLVMAEQAGQSARQLECFYQLYLRSVEEYLLCCQVMEQRLVS